MLTDSDYEICTPDIGTFDVTVRILGKPGGTLDICVNDLSDVLDETFTGDAFEDCLIGEVNLSRKVSTNIPEWSSSLDISPGLSLL